MTPQTPSSGSTYFISRGPPECQTSRSSRRRAAALGAWALQRAMRDHDQHNQTAYNTIRFVLIATRPRAVPAERGRSARPRRRVTPCHASTQTLGSAYPG